MKQVLLTLVILSMATLGAAQEATTTPADENKTTPQAQTTSHKHAAQTADHPEGTVPTEKHIETVVQPKPKQVKPTSNLIRGAQAKLNAMGYDPGPANGTLNARTRAAIGKFQAAENLKVTRQLDEPTLTKLNVGGTNMITAAPADAGRGAVAAGHNVKEGHPIAAGKAIGKGAGRFGKKVGTGTKALVVGTKDKLLGTKPKEDTKPSNSDQPKL
jgi:peptidoglycan hydrolase-like protein with peptidoglycan-binding domain